MNIYERLRKDHDIQRELIDNLIETQGDSDQRDHLFAQIRTELQSHAAAEERCFYAPLMEHDLTLEKSRHGVAEHHEIDELLEQLEQTDYSSPAWLTTAKQLAHQIHHHLDEEEQEVFQLSGKVLSDTQKTALSKNYQAEMDSQREQRS